MAKPWFEPISRSITKAVTFRIVILVSDSVIVYALTHRVDLTVGVMIFSNLASTILYIFHERAWNKISWGRK
jgi:uncharacterized membrane protein